MGRNTTARERGQIDLYSHVLRETAKQARERLGPGCYKRLYAAHICHAFKDRGYEASIGESVEHRYQGESIGSEPLDLVIDGRILVAITVEEPIEERTTALLKAFHWMRLLDWELAVEIHFPKEGDPTQTAMSNVHDVVAAVERIETSFKRQHRGHKPSSSGLRSK